MGELLNALITCNIKKVKFMMEYLENIDFPVSTSYGLTALHVAAGLDSPAKNCLIDYLLERGANPNARSNEGITPVHIAVMWGNSGVLEKLMRHGGSPWLLDCDYKNAFHMAAEEESGKCLQILDKYKDIIDLVVPDSDSDSVVENTATSESVPETDLSDLSDPIVLPSITEDVATKNYYSLFSEHYESATDKFVPHKNVLGERMSSNFQKHVEIDDDNAKTVTWKVGSSHGKFAAESTKSDKKFCPGGTEIQSKNISKCDELINKISSATFIVEDTLSSISDVIEEDSSGKYDSDKEIKDYVEGDVLPSNVHDVEGDVLPSNVHDVEGDVLPSNVHEESLNSGTDWQLFHNARENTSTTNSYLLEHSASSIPSELCNLDNTEIYQQLRKYGDSPGPILGNTRKMYLRRLAMFKNGSSSLQSIPSPKYSTEIYLHMEGKMDLNKVRIMDKMISLDFSKWPTMQKCKERLHRSYFNYFLLDPRVTRNLPARAHLLTDEEKFHTFINALFYIGKGTRSRPYDHLSEAVKFINSPEQGSAKTQHIVDIWKSGSGIISVHCFHSSYSVEALTYEACMIDALGLTNLANVKKGNYFGVAAGWTIAKKKQLGVFYLSRAMAIFLHDGERLIGPKDI